MLAFEVPFLAAQAGNDNSTLPFQKPDHAQRKELSTRISPSQQRESREAANQSDR
jgi:hypothetical protein